MKPGAPFSNNAVLREIGSGQWVRDRLLLTHPDLLRNKGADLDRNGRITANEQFSDFDHDGTVGTIDDFITYYLNNQSAIEKHIPYFRWAASMDPGNMCALNPLHDYLSLAMNVVPAADVRDAYAMIQDVIAGARLFAMQDSAPSAVRHLVRQGLADIHARLGAMPLPPASLITRGIVHQFTGVDLTDDADVQLDPQAAKVHASLYAYVGQAWAQRGDLDRARAHYETAVALDPDDTFARHNLGEILIQLKDYAAALTIYNDILDGEPGAALAHVGMGRVWHARGKMDRALDEFAIAIALDPRLAEAYFRRARLWHDKGETKLALKDYTRAFKRDRHFAAAYYYCGVILHERGRTRNALWCYDKAVASDRHGASAVFFNDRGMVHHALRRYDQAERDFTEAIKRDPDFALAYNNRGYLRHDREKLLDALLDYNKAIALNPRYVDALVNRGDLHFNLKDYDKAQWDYAAAVQLNPNCAAAHFGLGLLHEKNNRDTEALLAFKKAIDIDPKRAPAFYFFQRGLIWEKKENYHKAHADFTETINRDRNHAEAYNHRSIVRKEMKDYLGSQSDLSVACRLDPTICQIKQDR